MVESFTRTERIWSACIVALFLPVLIWADVRFVQSDFGPVDREGYVRMKLNLGIMVLDNGGTFPIDLVLSTNPSRRSYNSFGGIWRIPLFESVVFLESQYTLHWVTHRDRDIFFVKKGEEFISLDNNWVAKQLNDKNFTVESRDGQYPKFLYSDGFLTEFKIDEGLPSLIIRRNSKALVNSVYFQDRTMERVVLQPDRKGNIVLNSSERFVFNFDSLFIKIDKINRPESFVKNINEQIFIEYSQDRNRTQLGYIYSDGSVGDVEWSNKDGLIASANGSEYRVKNSSVKSDKKAVKREFYPNFVSIEKFNGGQVVESRIYESAKGKETVLRDSGEALVIDYSLTSGDTFGLVRQVQSLDEFGTIRSSHRFSYDQFGRPTRVTDRHNNLLEEYYYDRDLDTYSGGLSKISRNIDEHKRELIYENGQFARYMVNGVTVWKINK